jgi:hypothetical protein
MPTLTTEEPDSHDLDYYYNKYPDRFGIGTKESDPLTLRILPKDVKPTKCETNKQQHYFQMPTQPTLSTCLCGKFHTNFTSKHYKTTYTTPLRQTSKSTAMDISPTTVISKNHLTTLSTNYLNHLLLNNNKVFNQLLKFYHPLFIQIHHL